MAQKNTDPSFSLTPSGLFCLLCLLLCLCMTAPAAAAGGKPVPMDAAAATDAGPAQAEPTDIGSSGAAASPAGNGWSTGESGSWSLDAQESKEKKQAAGAAAAGATTDAAAPDDQTFHSGYWSAGNKTPGAADAPKNSGAADGGPSLSGDQDIYQSHSAVVTTVQACYDQLGPVAAAEIRGHYVKPYEECQQRLAEKIQQKNQAKAGQLQESLTPETPRNYIRVQNSPTPQ